MKVLLIENDNLLIKDLTKYLMLRRYILDVAKEGEMGWTYGSTFDYDLIILDVAVPKLDGISLCKRFRTEGFTTPILLLSDQDTTTAKVEGLDAGADDYVVKPFEAAELLARVRALLRRSSTNPLPILAWGDLLLNLSTYEVSYNGQPLTLSTMEYELLELLLRDSQHVFSTDEIIDRLWSLEQFPSEATVRSHIRRVRQKLVESGAPKDFIATVHGRGYYLKASKREEASPSSTIPAQALPFSEPHSLLRPARQNQPTTHRTRNLILMSSDVDISHSLVQAAEKHGLHLQSLSGLPQQSGLDLQASNGEFITQYPDAILFQFPSESRRGDTARKPMDQSSELSKTWRFFSHYYPDVPVLVMAEQGELRDRIEVLRWGGRLFLELGQPEQVIEAVVQFLDRLNRSSKVMVLDDDQDWLYAVTTLLKPWGFKVTTLADPQQFWTVIKAVMPDALVLDLHLSEVSGLEICGLLRSDPVWCQLPILFLSAPADAATQRQAFKAGADDYLHKPIMGFELAERILNRLQRRAAP
ncbi:Alkaline phosphatase synthesis transcriptional regulatory protein SphR [Acaryochloris thomasi RCC1774]|uniref:Alkaline phosphatase synthesis transcriptional regulatory protein SphR n=1 Tax=Acaryochloris thomasi RCC1774 TaxID=1764569 RepID=A0A2W1J8W6_9CYAN|nr:response regulator transcription factor [Acaryochloris thomasi]PZD70759.1 Alkaline phosphatase synthesis transcriptional regulatory protein SphR [Acaryochloris thomasi RCC1774]